MADPNADKIQSEGVEVAENPDVVNFEDGLEATTVDGVTSVGIKDGGVAAVKLVGSEARTATEAGLTTGAITPPTSYITFVAVTSGAATSQIALPAISAATIGQMIYLTVGSNGYELITPASSGNTINRVDGDGTNQLDVAANTTVRATQIAADAWLAETIAATSIAVTAPDND
jgi:hypothetical protein